MHNPLGQRGEVITMIDDDGAVHTLTEEEADRELEIRLVAHCVANHIDRDKIDAVQLGIFYELPVVQALLALKYPQRRD